jgi:hypothetical protein
MSRLGVVRLAFIGLLISLVSAASFADSHVRIVRLSSVEGQVQVDRAVGGGLERAILNTPIVQGARLVTGNDGLAEVEFENESAIRLTEDSEIQFTQLSLSDAGARVNRIEVLKGVVYVDAAKGDDTYLVKVGDSTLLVHSNTLMRLSMAPEQAQVAVFKGEVQLENQPVSVRRKETLTLSLQDPAKYAIENGTDAIRYDAWNREREEYSRTYAENAGYGGPNHGYGLQDLNYYGDYFYAPGYGYAWQPYGFSGSMLGWDPYSNGAWSFYPGFGYLWASAYPWGWLPYHYGSWAFINGRGWAWVPGRGYNGVWAANNFVPVPKITRAPAGWQALAPPIHNGVSVPRTVPVGTTSSTALTIPGGRVPPTFGNVIAGRPAATLGSTNTGPAAAHGFTKPGPAATQGFAKPGPSANSGHSTFAPRPVGASGGASTHVFAEPTPRATAAGPALGVGPAGSGALGAAPNAHAGSMGTAHGSQGSQGSQGSAHR